MANSSTDGSQSNSDESEASSSYNSSSSPSASKSYSDHNSRTKNQSSSDYHSSASVQSKFFLDNSEIDAILKVLESLRQQISNLVAQVQKLKTKAVENILPLNIDPLVSKDNLECSDSKVSQEVFALKEQVLRQNDVIAKLIKHSLLTDDIDFNHLFPELEKDSLDTKSLHLNYEENS